MLLSIEMLSKPMQEVDNFDYIRKRNEILLELTHFIISRSKTFVFYIEGKWTSLVAIQLALKNIYPSLRKNDPMCVQYGKGNKYFSSIRDKENIYEA